MDNHEAPPSNNLNTGMKRIATMTGAYAVRNHTIRDIRENKGKRVFVETLTFSPDEAAAAEMAGFDTLKVRYDPSRPETAKEIRRAASKTFMSFSMPLTAVTTPEQALRLAFDAMEIGADAIMCQWNPRFIAACAEAYVPVQGHVGLVPRRCGWTGGLRAVGKTLEQAIQIYKEVKALESAGAWAVEVEVVPAEVLRAITRRTSLITTSIGSGPHGDIQFLFAQDILGYGKPPFPRHSKQYRNFNDLYEKLQSERVSAFSEFISDVRANAFPSREHTVSVDDKLIDELSDQLDNL